MRTNNREHEVEELFDVLPSFLLQKALKTKHSQTRQQQRGVSDLIRNLILEFGETFPVEGSAVAKQLPGGFLQVVERATRFRVIIKDGYELTWEHIIKGAKRRSKE